MDHFQDIFQSERFEVEAIRRVVIRRDRLRIAVDHHRLVTSCAQRETSMNTGVVELDTLPDSIRSRAQDDDRRLLSNSDFALLIVRGIVVWSLRFELSCTGIDRLVDGSDSEAMARSSDFGLVETTNLSDLCVRETMSFQLMKNLCIKFHRISTLRCKGVQEMDLFKHPWIESGDLLHLVETDSSE